MLRFCNALSVTRRVSATAAQSPDYASVLRCVRPMKWDLLCPSALYVPNEDFWHLIWKLDHTISLVFAV